MPALQNSTATGTKIQSEEDAGFAKFYSERYIDPVRRGCHKDPVRRGYRLRKILQRQSEEDAGFSKFYSERYIHPVRR